MLDKKYRVREQTHRKYRVFRKVKTIPLDGSQFHCRVIGKGPSLVVLHGKFKNTYDYEKLCHNLAHWFTVYGINHRGNDESNEVQGWITICKKTG